MATSAHHATVRIRPQHGRLAAILVTLVRLAWFSVLGAERPSTNTPAPLTPIRAFLDSAKARGDGSPIRLQGVVTLAMPDGTLFMQEDGAGTRIYTREPITCKTGDRVEVTGVVSLFRPLPTVRDAAIVQLDSGHSIEAPLLTAAEAMGGRHSMSLVRMRGRLLNERVIGGWVLLVKPVSGTEVIAVELAALNDVAELATLEPESLVEITGVLSRRRSPKGEPIGIQLHVRSVDDLRLIEGPPLFTTRHLTRLLGSVTLVLAASIGWIITLQRQVRKQTHQIERRLEEEASLRASEDRFAKVFRAAPDPILIVDLATMTFMDVNPAFESESGHRRADTLGRTPYDLNLWAQPEQCARALAELESRGSVTNFECAVRTDHRGILHYLGSAEHIELNGRRCALVTIRNITERRETELVLRRSEEALRRAQSIARMGNWSFDTATGLFAGSEESRRIFGWDGVPQTISELIQIIHPEDLAAVEAAWDATLAGAPFDIEHRVITNQEVRWVHSRAEPETDSGGRVIRITGITHEITERKRDQLALKEREALFRAIAEQTPDSLFLIDIGDPKFPGVILYANTSAARMHGFTVDELRGRTLAELTNPETGRAVTDPIRRLRAGESVSLYCEHRRKDGTTFPVESVARPVPALGGNVALVIDRDITERRQAELALTASEQRYRQAFEINTAIKLILDAESGRILDANSAACDYYGYTRDQLLSLSITDVNCRPAWEAQSRAEGLAADNRPYSQVRHRLASGEVRDVEIYSSPLQIDGRRLLYSIIHDITERKRAESLSSGQLRVLEMIAQQWPVSDTLDALLQLIEEQAPEMYCSVLILDRDGRRLRHGAAPRLPAEYTRAIDGVVIGPRVGSCGTAAYLRQPVLVADIATDPFWADFRHLALRHGLSACWSHPVFDAQERTLGTLAVYTREPGMPTPRHRRLIELALHTAAICIAHHEAGDELRQSRQRFADLVASVGGIVWEASPDTLRFSFVSQAAERLLGHPTSEWLQPDFRPTRIHPEDRERVLSTLQANVREGRNHEIEYRMFAADGRWIWLRDLVTVSRQEVGPPSLSGLMVDITEKKTAEEERRQLQARLQQAQKMESLGTLAGGIAHDFNNILGAILGNIDLVRQDIGHGHPAGDFVEEIRKAGLRARDLVKQILAFSRQQPRELRVVLLDQVLEDGIKLLRSTVPSTIQIHYHLNRDCPPVMADPAQIHQILLNLGTNAWHAMENRAGAITIGLQCVRLDSESTMPHPDLKPGLYAQLYVSDEGVGIDAATRERIFDPFFTTKGIGKGTGLGLAIVHGIVRSHAGAIAVQSIPGRGSTFEIYLPALETIPDLPEPVPRESTPPTGRGQRILLIDDEPQLVTLAQRSLERLGYHVDGFTHAHEAIEFLQRDPSRFQLVVTDLNMPDVSGLDVINEIRAMCPHIPIVLSSGFVTDEVRASALERGACDVFYKPGTMRELAEMLDRVFAR